MATVLEDVQLAEMGLAGVKVKGGESTNDKAIAIGMAADPEPSKQPDAAECDKLLAARLADRETEAFLLDLLVNELINFKRSMHTSVKTLSQRIVATVLTIDRSEGVSVANRGRQKGKRVPLTPVVSHAAHAREESIRLSEEKLEPLVQRLVLEATAAWMQHSKSVIHNRISILMKGIGKSRTQSKAVSQLREYELELSNKLSKTIEELSSKSLGMEWVAIDHRPATGELPADPFVEKVKKALVSKVHATKCWRDLEELLRKLAEDPKQMVKPLSWLASDTNLIELQRKLTKECKVVELTLDDLDDLELPLTEELTSKLMQGLYLHIEVRLPREGRKAGNEAGREKEAGKWSRDTGSRMDLFFRPGVSPLRTSMRKRVGSLATGIAKKYALQKLNSKTLCAQTGSEPATLVTLEPCDPSDRFRLHALRPIRSQSRSDRRGVAQVAAQVGRARVEDANVQAERRPLGACVRQREGRTPRQSRVQPRLLA